MEMVKEQTIDLGAATAHAEPAPAPAPTEAAPARGSVAPTDSRPGAEAFRKAMELSKGLRGEEPTAPSPAPEKVEEKVKTETEPERKQDSHALRQNKRAAEFLQKRSRESAEIESLKKEIEALKAANAPAPKDEPKLSRKDFQNEDDFRKYQVQEEVRSLMTSADAESKARASVTKRDVERGERWRANAQALFGEQAVDVLQSARQLDAAKLGEEVVDYLFESSVGPAMAAFLATHPDNFETLRGLSKYRKATYLSNLEAKIYDFLVPSEEEPEPAAKPKAAPPTTGRLGSGSVDSFSSSGVSALDVSRRMIAEQKRRGLIH